jgi:pyrroline-5-carboxylate reductase
MAYGVLGVGAIGAAIVTGLCENVADAPRMLLSPRNAEIAAGLAQRFATVDVAPDNQAVVDGARVVIVCVRPQVAQPVLAELRFPADGVVISAMAGVSVTALKRLVAPATDVARVIPLPSVARRDSLTPVRPPNAAASALFDRLGETVELADVKAFEALLPRPRRSPRTSPISTPSPRGSSCRRSLRRPRHAMSLRCSPGSPKRRGAGSASSCWRASMPPQAGSTSSF